MELKSCENCLVILNVANEMTDPGWYQGYDDEYVYDPRHVDYDSNERGNAYVRKVSSM